MCDELTEIENQVYLQRRLSRREVSAGAGATLAGLWTGCAASQAGSDDARAASPPAGDRTAAGAASAPNGEGASATATSGAVEGRLVTIETPDGSAEGWFMKPKRGEHPGVLIWPDIAGLRDAFKTMAARLAGAGYAVLVVNPYYRSTGWAVFETFDEWRTEAGREQVQPLRAELTPDAVERDAVALLSWLDRQEGVARDRKMAVTGYCMTGPFTFYAAAAAAQRVGAIASFHGGGLVTDAATSPHRTISKMKAAALVCIAQNDDEREPEAKHVLREAAQHASVPAEIEVYPAQHGFCVLDTPVYDEAQAERAWARMLATFEQHL